MNGHRAPNLIGLALPEARCLAQQRVGAAVEVHLVESDGESLQVVAQHPKEGAALDGPIRLEVATKSWRVHLPAIYEDADEENGDFLKRFLLIQQHLSASIEERVSFQHTTFDPRLTPEHFLPWLASWLALPSQEGWSESRRREIIQRAPELHQKRGTAEGLRLALRLFAETESRVIESVWPYPGFIIGKSAVIGRNSTLSRPVVIAQCFVVKLSEEEGVVSAQRMRTIHAVVEAEKPAHARYALLFSTKESSLPPVTFLRAGKETCIGVNARIGGRGDGPFTQESS